MKIDISRIASTSGGSMCCEVCPELSSFRFKPGEFQITDMSPIALTIQSERKDRIRILGEASLQTVIPCDRCLCDVTVPIHFSIDKTLRKEGDDFVDDEMEETDYLIGLELDVERFVYAEILVNWPMKVLCKDDCKGICRKCGKNLNKGACACRQTELDPRMAAIQDVFQQFKEV